MGLPNDDCAITREVELRFLEERNLRACSTQCGENCCVLYSRITNTGYEWPKDMPLSCSDLRVFSDCGHTLGIDYTKTYSRKLSLDLDCICRKNPQSVTHLNENLAQSVLQEVRYQVNNIVDLPNVLCVLWRNGCGFHLYCDVNVSLPTHLLIARIVSSKFAEHDIVIEVPSVMPLPYSAKISGQPYRPLLPSQESFELLMNYTRDCYYDVFEYTNLQTNRMSVAHISKRTGDMYVNKRETALKRFAAPKFTHVSYVKIYPQFEFMNQLSDYIRNVVLNEKNVMIFDNFDLSSIESSDMREKILTFMALFNRRFDNQNTTECNLFVKASLLQHGGLYLQPYVVMLNKYLQPVDDETFKLVLEAIYARYVHSDVCVARFIKYYDKHTLNCYNDDCDFMMEHLCFLYVNDVSPCDSLDHQMEKLFQARTLEESSVTFRKSLHAMDKKAKSETIATIIDLYVEALLQLQGIMYNTSTSNYYILENGTHYRMAGKIEILPTVIYNWIGTSKKIIEEIHSTLDMYKLKYTMSQASLLSSCKFQFSTTVGVFNSLTGMYTAKTRFLRFLCYRDFAIWKPNAQFVMYERQNYDILEQLAIAERFAAIMHNDIVELFVHFLLAPALIQMKNIMFIEESRINKLIYLLARHKDLSSAYFIVEYLPIDPRFIYVLMYIYKKEDGFNSLETYAKMCDHIFHFHKVDEESWSRHFAPMLSRMRYERKETHMSTLMTIDDGDLVQSVSPEFCFYITVIAACIVKCPAYGTLVSAFGVTSIPETLAVHPHYEAFRCDMGIENFRTNMRRATDIVFGRDLRAEEQIMITAMFSLGMSSYFDPDTTIELLASFSAMFVPYNVLKKIFLYHGTGGVGKSLICNIIQRMGSPKVGRWNNLSQAMDRANVTAKNNVTILNEVRYVDAEKIKTITGNDAESMKQFYTQEYEMHNSQSLIYGATNSIITFRGQTDVDLVSVNRFHVIKLTGQQRSVDFKSYSFFEMLTDQQLYNGTIDAMEPELANATSWLAYASYVLRRDKNNFPMINENNVHSRQYREDVYRNNNRLYSFISNLGITEENGFSIPTNLLMKIARRSLDTRKGQKVESISDFKQKLEVQYGIKLDFGGTVPNMQQIGLIEHIFNNMCVYEMPNCIIRREDIELRVGMYSDFIDKDNARSYFQRENEMFYDFQRGVYCGIAFKLDCIKYDGNENEDACDLPQADFRIDQDP